MRGFVELKVLVLAGAALIALPSSAADLKVFAAASLTEALDDVLALCATQTEGTATGIYAGSGTIARQIDQGAPADIYISANPQWMDWLEKRGRIVEETRLDLLGNALVMITSTSYEKDALADSNNRLALADPETVPAGIYAKQALRASGMWDTYRDRLIPAANVREALAWVARGEVALGIVYATDAKNDDRVKKISKFNDLSHDPIRYPAAVIADNDSPDARRLLACLTGEEASNIFENYGFSVL